MALPLWMYLTPIIYPQNLVPEKLQFLTWINPMAVLVTAMRDVMLFDTAPGWRTLAGTTGLSAVLLVVAYRYFKRGEPALAEAL